MAPREIRGKQEQRIFKWGVAHELARVAIYQALATLDNLRRGRSRAKDPEPVKPVPKTHVKKARAALPPISTSPRNSSATVSSRCLSARPPCAHGEGRGGGIVGWGRGERA